MLFYIIFWLILNSFPHPAFHKGIINHYYGYFSKKTTKQNWEYAKKLNGT